MGEMDSSERFLVYSRFWIQRVLVPIAVLIGVGGNIMTVIVLTRRRMRNSTNVYLTALAVADLIYLFFVLILSFEHYPNIHDIKYNLFWRFYGISHWFCDAASSTSVWLTVSFTIERYVAVCHPIRGKVLCTERRAKNIIWIISLLCFIFTATTPLEYQLKLEQICLQRACYNCTSDAPVQHETLEKIMNHSEPVLSLNNSTDSDLDNYIGNFTSEFLNDSRKPEETEMVIPLDLLNVIIDNDEDIEQQISNDSVARSYENRTTSSDHKLKTKQGDSWKFLNETSTSAITQSSDNRTTNHKFNDSSPFSPSSSEPPDIIKVDHNLTRLRSNFSTCMENNLPPVPFVMKDNETCCIKTSHIDTELTKLGKNKTYKTVYYWFSSIVFGLLPLVLIATFNCFLVSAVYKSQKQRKVMTNSQEQMSQSQENRITLLLIGVVFLFLVCQTPTASFLIYDAFDDTKDPYSRNIKKGLGNIFNFLCTLNASCNFILYCVLSDKFRRTFKIVFCSRGLSRQDTLITLTGSRSTSQRFHSQRNLIKRGTSEYAPRTPRNLETQSLNSIPRTKSLLQRQLGKAKTRDLNV